MSPTPERPRRILLRDVTNGENRSWMDVSIDEDGDLVLDGMDMGPLAERMGRDAYEYRRTVRAAHLPALRTLLGIAPDADLLDALLTDWSGRASFELEIQLDDPSVHAELRVD